MNANQQREWIKNNPEKKRAYTRKSTKKHYHLWRRVVIIGYGGRCSCCGESNLKFLTLDHADDSAADDRKNGIFMNGTFYRRIA